MVKPKSSRKGEEEEDGPIAGEFNAGPTQLDVLGIGDELFEQIFIHERFGDVSDEVCDRLSLLCEAQDAISWLFV
jgi:hypothetical protein